MLQTLSKINKLEVNIFTNRGNLPPDINICSGPRKNGLFEYVKIVRHQI